jgi:hypothetical protein
MLNPLRVRSPLVPVLVAAALLAGSPLPGAHLQPESISAWTTYATATERRIADELASRDSFLAMDFAPAAAADRRATLGGEIVVRAVETKDERGQDIEIPSALLHHWRGAILIPGVTVTGLVAALQSGPPATKPEDVLQSAVIARGPDWMKIYLKLQRRKFVTVVYNTEHLVTYTSYGPTRASSRSTATKIAELVDPGTPTERELPPGDDRGFLWRLNAYWRYEEVPGGVIAECESISLSRNIPAVFRFLVMPMVRSAARESMEKTLIALRAKLETPPVSSPAR